MKQVIFCFLVLCSTGASAQYSADEMCDLIPTLYRGKQMHIFFDAQDTGFLGFVRRTTEFYTFSIESERAGGVVLLTKLGEQFNGFPSGLGFVIPREGEPNIYYRTGEIPNGRVLTKIFSYPKKIPSSSTQPTWSIYKLCRQEHCDGPHGQKGEWQKIGDNIDQIPMNFADVFAFYFNRNREPPKLECLPDPIHIEGPLERH